MKFVMSRIPRTLWIPLFLACFLLGAILWRARFKTQPIARTVHGEYRTSRASDAEQPTNEIAKDPIPPGKTQEVAAGVGRAKASIESPEEWLFHPGADRLVALKDWDEFYRDRGCQWFSPFELTDLILRRLVIEVGLTKSQCDRIQTLLKREHNEAAQEILTKFGSARLMNEQATSQNRSQFEGLVGPDRQELLEGLAATLEEVRRRYDGEYASALDASQLTAVNEHLRNKNHTLCWGYMKRHRDEMFGVDSHQDEAVRIVGVGRRAPQRHTYYDGGITAGGEPIFGIETEDLTSATK
jgi:hypothetical protein